MATVSSDKDNDNTPDSEYYPVGYNIEEMK